MKNNDYNCRFGCPVEATLEVIGGKWKAVILYHLLDGTKRFNQLKRLVPGVTQRMLTRQLRELEADNIIDRKIYAEIPPKVEYSISKFGETLQPILALLQDWGVEYLDKVAEIRIKNRNLGTNDSITQK